MFWRLIYKWLYKPFKKKMETCALEEFHKNNPNCAFGYTSKAEMYNLPIGASAIVLPNKTIGL